MELDLTTTEDTASDEQLNARRDERHAGSHRAMESRILFAGGRDLVIFHYGETYHLRETRQRKLILTK